MNREVRWTVHRYDRVASTMDQAAALARFGAYEGTVVVSAAQSAGRGRGGRQWQAPPGSGLFCTLILRPGVPADRLGVLPLIMGLAAAEAVESLVSAPVRLKWPNDIWIGGDPDRQKIAGILTTSRLAGDRVEHVLVGIGINLTTDTAELPPGATSLHAATGTGPSATVMLERLLDRIGHEYAGYFAADGRPSLDRWRARAALLGEQVSIAGDRELRGRFVDIDDDGSLVLDETDSGIRRIVAGDLARGPRTLLPTEQGD